MNSRVVGSDLVMGDLRNVNTSLVQAGDNSQEELDMTAYWEAEVGDSHLGYIVPDQPGKKNVKKE